MSDRKLLVGVDELGVDESGVDEPGTHRVTLEKIGHHTLSTRLRAKYLPSATTTTTGMRAHVHTYAYATVLLSS